MLVQPHVLPLLDRLPKSWTRLWLQYACHGPSQHLWLTLVSALASYRSWHAGYTPFQEIGSDTIILVSPNGNTLTTCDPALTHHMFKDTSFGKPIELMSLLNIFGPTVTGTDGPEARLYRKVTSPFLNEETNKSVWKHTVSGAGSLAQVINEHGQNLRPILVRFTLHLLDVICFERPPSFSDVLELREDVPSGHALGYSQAMETFLEHFLIIYGTPSLVLSSLNGSHRCPSRLI